MSTIPLLSRDRVRCFNMATHINSLRINSYRGIRDLAVDNLGDVNILLGDNNAGKTSVLESIQLLGMPNQYGLIQVARQRESGRSVLRSRLGILDSVLFLFNVYDEKRRNNQFSIEIGGTVLGQSGSLKVDVEIVEQLIDWNAVSKYERRSYKESDSNLEEEVPTLIGSVHNSFKKYGQLSLLEDNPERIEINNYSRTIRSRNENSPINVRMVQTIDHLAGDNLNALLRDKKKKDRAVELLQNFEDDICDIRYIGEEASLRFYPVIESKHHDYLPLSLYGDGMKKVLTVLNALVGMENGVVLIDEFETALHTSVMQKVFRIMIDLAKELHIQLFLTTHSIEAVDKLLECADSHIDDIRIIRLKKKNNRTYARVTNGKEALKGRTENNMEYRI